MNTSYGLDQVISVVEDLCEVLAAENEALAAHDTSTVAQLQERKGPAARAYATLMQGIDQVPAVVVEASEEERATLRAGAERLAEISEENGRLLRLTMDAHQRVIDAFVRGARELQSESALYTKSGVMDAHRRPVALSHNQAY